MSNPYAPQTATLEDVIVETPTIRTLVIRPGKPMPFRAGQFVQLTVPGVGEAPFTPSSSPQNPERIEVTILRTGQVTDILHTLEAGADVGLRGPFGKGYPVERFRDKEVLLVGGGVGLAPLRSLMYQLFHDMSQCRSVLIRYGARSPDELLFQRTYEQWGALEGVDMDVTVDAASNGWAGKVGVVTTLLAEGQFDAANGYVVSCGPGVMLRFVTFRCLELGYDASRIYLSMNRRMSCGIGRCGRCNIGPYYLCKDGPDMCYDKIRDYPNVF